jgi:hypothetical protein
MIFWFLVSLGFFGLSFWSATMTGRMLAGRTTINPVVVLLALFAPWAALIVAATAPGEAFNVFAAIVVVFGAVEAGSVTVPQKPLSAS